MLKKIIILFCFVTLIGFGFYFLRDEGSDKQKELTKEDLFDLKILSSLEEINLKDLDFGILIAWSENCIHCVKELEELETLNEAEYKDFYIVNLDVQSFVEAEKIVKKLGLSKPVFVPENISRFVEITKAMFLPMSLVIKNGKIVHRLLGRRSLEEFKNIIKEYK